MILQHDKLLFVAVPEASTEINLMFDKLYFSTEKYANVRELPEGNWQILGTITEIELSFDAEPFVEKVDYIINNQSQGILYRDYYYPDKDEFVSERYSKPEPSFRSLMQSIGAYLVNPYGEKDPISYINGAFYKQEKKRLKSDSLKWQRAQQTTSPKWVVLNK